MNSMNMSDEVVKFFTKNDGFNIQKDDKFPDKSDLAKQLETFAIILGTRAIDGNHRKWSRMINDNGKTANIIFTYSFSGDEARKLYGFDHFPFKDSGKLVNLGPINLDPVTFNDEILKRIAKMYNRGDGSKAKDVQLSIEDSNVTNPFDSSDFNVQAQLAFRVTLKDSDADEADE